MAESITWEEGAAICAASLTERLEAAPSLEYAYALALNDFYDDVGSDLTEDERQTWNLSSAMLKATSHRRVRGMTIREAYDAGMEHARTFDHSVLRAVADLAELEQAMFRLKPTRTGKLRRVN
jgi:hypothetical protein